MLVSGHFKKKVDIHDVKNKAVLLFSEGVTQFTTAKFSSAFKWLTLK
jgi:hypothetical protein